MHRITPGKTTIIKKYLLPALLTISVVVIFQILRQNIILGNKTNSPIHTQPSKMINVEVPVEQATKQPSQDILAQASIPRAIPILIYHKTPSNFAQQLDNLVSKGYTTISMNQLADYFDGIDTIPNKPVIITFDDGFSDQFHALDQLRLRNMKATLYMIIGGPKSLGCIGITRSNFSCGDDYMNWTQLKQLAQSNSIEIAAHTLNHPNLTSLTPEEQMTEISESKKILETELGKPITSLAYPYGRFNNTTVDLAKKAGFRTAVTTVDGYIQSSQNRLSLMRVRSALTLP